MIASCSTGWDSVLRASADHRAREHSTRVRRALTCGPGARVSDGSNQWINFSGNDYLGLRGHPAVAEALAGAATAQGTGSGASALVTGYHPEHERLERALADFLQREAVLLCSSGYLANLAVATSLAGRGDAIVQDRLCHASLIDAARLSGARLARYPHADVTGAGQQLARFEGGQRLLVTDGVFSMDGDSAPVTALAEQAREHDAVLVVDDAHGIGVLGDQGGGLVEQERLGADRVPVLVGTLGKALGCCGAFIAADRDLIEHLVNEARSYIYTTAMPPALAAAGSAALACLQAEAWRRDKLHELIAAWREGAARRGIPVLDSTTPIQPLVVGASADALAMSEALAKAGFLVAAIRPPTVPRGTARLRITLTAEHEPDQLDALQEAIEQCRSNR